MILKVVIRNFLKRPFLHLIKVVGLSLALTGIVFIALFLKMNSPLISTTKKPTEFTVTQLLILIFWEVRNLPELLIRGTYKCKRANSRNRKFCKVTAGAWRFNEVQRKILQH